jgi:uncharacterized protein DUF3455
MTRIPLLAVALAVALPAAAAISEPTGLSRAMRAPAAEEPAFMLSADGVHTYECKVLGNAPESYAWAATSPDATLYDGTHSVGTVSANNEWSSSLDRSSVSGVIRAMQGAGSGNLPWASLAAVPAGDSGLFAGVTSIQRVNTAGGAPPAAGCDAGTVGEEAQVAFRADYYFYKPRGTT